MGQVSSRQGLELLAELWQEPPKKQTEAEIRIAQLE